MNKVFLIVLFLMLSFSFALISQTVEEVQWQVNQAQEEYNQLNSNTDNESFTDKILRKLKSRKLERKIKNLKKVAQEVKKSENLNKMTFALPSFLNDGLRKYFNNIPVGGSDKKSPTAKIMLLNDNIESWYARWFMISNAKRKIDIVNFALFDDAFGRAFMGLLMEKANQGVKIRFLLDNRGGLNTTLRLTNKDILIELSKVPNIEIKIYNPVFSKMYRLFTQGLKTLWASDHDKLVIIDDQWLMIGGRNFWSHFFSGYKDDDKAYLDTDILIKNVKGNGITAAATKAFEEEFNIERSKKLKASFIDRFGAKRLKNMIKYARKAMDMYMIDDIIVPPNNDDEAEYNAEIRKFTQMKGGYVNFYKKITKYFNSKRRLDIYPIKLLDKSSTYGVGNNAITENVLGFMRASKKEIFIQNPYILLTPKAKSVLIDAANRGVKIRIFTASPTSSDEAFVQGLFIDEWKDLIRDIPGIRVQVSKDRPLHSKVFVFDSKVAIIGTYNFDPLSQNVNSEVVTAIYSKRFAKKVRDSILDRIKKYSVEYKLRINPDGSETVLYGPEDHCDRKKLLKIKILYKPLAKLLRPLL